jgi:hypothetical protein
MSAFYLPLDFPSLLQERRVQRLQERLAEAQLAVVTARTEERLQELADEIEAIELAWKEENRK